MAASRTEHRAMTSIHSILHRVRKGRYPHRHTERKRSRRLILADMQRSKRVKGALPEVRRELLDTGDVVSYGIGLGVAREGAFHAGQDGSARRGNRPAERL